MCILVVTGGGLMKKAWVILFVVMAAFATPCVFAEGDAVPTTGYLKVIVPNAAGAVITHSSNVSVTYDSAIDGDLLASGNRTVVHALASSDGAVAVYSVNVAMPNSAISPSCELVITGSPDLLQASFQNSKCMSLFHVSTERDGNTTSVNVRRN